MPVKACPGTVRDRHPCSVAFKFKHRLDSGVRRNDGKMSSVAINEFITPAAQRRGTCDQDDRAKQPTSGTVIGLTMHEDKISIALLEANFFAKVGVELVKEL
jgi:hypothetical protein